MTDATPTPEDCVGCCPGSRAEHTCTTIAPLTDADLDAIANAAEQRWGEDVTDPANYAILRLVVEVKRLRATEPHREIQAAISVADDWQARATKAEAERDALRAALLAIRKEACELSDDDLHEREALIRCEILDVANNALGEA